MWVATAEMEEQQQVLPFFSRQSWASGIFECTRSPHSTWQNASLHWDWKQKPGEWCFQGNRSEVHQSGSMPCPLPDRPLGQRIRNACPYTSTQTCGLCHPLLCMKTLPQEIAKLTLVGITWSFLLQMKEKRKSLRKFDSWAPPKVFQAWHVMENQPATQETTLPALWRRSPEQRACQGHEALEADDLLKVYGGKDAFSLPGLLGAEVFCSGTLLGTSWN